MTDMVLKATTEGFVQVTCRHCGIAQDIPEPPKSEFITLFPCEFCDAVNRVELNSTERRHDLLLANVLMAAMTLLVILLVLGAVGLVTWLVV